MTSPSSAQQVPSAAAPARHVRHWLVVLGAACMMITGQFTFLSASIVNPPLAESLGVGLSEVMVFNSLMALSGVVSMTLLAPLLYRRFGVRTSVIAGGLWVAVTMGAVSFVSSLAWLYVLGFAVGLLYGAATMMGATMLVNTWFEARRGTALGAVFALSGLGGISAGLVLPAVVSAGGWERGFQVMGGLAIVLIVLPGIFLIRSHPSDVGLRPYGAPAEPERDAAEQESQAAPESEAAGEHTMHLPGVPARMAFRSPQFVAFALAVLLFALVQGVQQHFAPMMVERGVTLAVAGTLISVMALASVFTNIALGTLNDRRGTFAAVALALGCQLAAMLAYTFSVGFLPLAISTVLFAFAAAVPGVLIPVLVVLLFGMRDFPTILGPAMALMPAGMAFATPLWGAAFDVTGSYRLPLLVSAALTVVVALLLMWAMRTAPALRSRVERTLGQTYATEGT